MKVQCDHHSTQLIDDMSTPKIHKMEYLIIAAILLLGLSLRLALVSGTQIDTPFRADAREYTAYTYNLKLHGIYSLDFNGLTDKRTIPAPDAVRPPGYPLFLSLFTSAKGLDRFAINVFYFQAILSAVTIAGVYLLSRTLLNVSGSTTTATLTAISPNLINLNIYLLTETLFTFSLVLFIGTFIMARRYDNRCGWIASGMLLAFAALVKPTVQYYLFFLVGFIFFGVDKGEREQIIVPLTISFLGIFSIWLIRNLVSLGYLSDPTLTINTLHHGMYPQFMYTDQVSTFGFPYRFDPHSQEIASSLPSVLTTIAHRFLTEPLLHLIWYLSKPLYLFRWEMIQGIGTFIYPVANSPYESSWLFVSIKNMMRAVHPVMVSLSLFGAILVWFPKAMAD